METGENIVQNIIGKSSNGLTNNNNSIQLNGSIVADDTLVATATATTTNSVVIHKDIGFGEANESQNNTDIQKPNVFELIGGNENCDSSNGDRNRKIILNNNDLAIGFVDDDDDDDGNERNAENQGDTTTFNHCDSDEATKGHANNIG